MAAGGAGGEPMQPVAVELGDSVRVLETGVRGVAAVVHVRHLVKVAVRVVHHHPRPQVQPAVHRAAARIFVRRV